MRQLRLRRASFPSLFLPEIPVGSALPAAAVAIAAAGYGGALGPALAAFSALWFGAEIALARIAGWHCSWRLMLALVLRDLLLPALWMGALAGRKFEWRGNAMRAIPPRREAGGQRPKPQQLQVETE